MTKLYRLFTIVLLGIAACNEAAESSETNPVAAISPEPHAAPVDSAQIDPVCGMLRDSTWTDYAVCNSDTFWFCAAPERDAFAANPGKFLRSGPSVSMPQ